MLNKRRMAYATICIRKGPASLLPWTMYQVGLDWTFAKLLETGLTRLAPVMDPEEPECYICKEMDPFLASLVQVMLGYNVFECCRINGNFVWYVYSASASRDIVLPERSAATAKELKWPEMNFKTAEEYQGGNGDKQLYDDIIRFLQSKRLGFVGGCHHTSGKEYVRTLQAVLFALQPHLHTLQTRNATFCSALFFISAGKSV